MKNAFTLPCFLINSSLFLTQDFGESFQIIFRHIGLQLTHLQVLHHRPVNVFTSWPVVNFTATLLLNMSSRSCAMSFLLTTVSAIVRRWWSSSLAPFGLFSEQVFENQMKNTYCTSKLGAPSSLLHSPKSSLPLIVVDTPQSTSLSGDNLDCFWSC
jgi:hypothetical protein